MKCPPGTLHGQSTLLLWCWVEAALSAAAAAAPGLVCQSFSGGGGVQISCGADHAFPDKME